MNLLRKMSGYSIWYGHPLMGLVLLLVIASLCSACENPAGVAMDAESESEQLTTMTNPAVAADCATGTQPGGAMFEICIPQEGQDANTLVVYSHGFVFPQAPLMLPRYEAGMDVREFVLNQGHSYAATSFDRNGLVDAKKAVRDLRNLITQFTQLHGRPERVLLFGVSNGALIATLALEHNPGLYDGAFAACAPVGDYSRQVNYLADIFVLFQHYFPGVIEGSPEGFAPEYIRSLAIAAAQADPPQSLEAYLTSRIVGAMTANPAAMLELFSVIKSTPEIAAGFDPSSVQEGLATIVRAVIYNVLATNNGREVLGGNFFDNSDRWYVGSSDDAALNAGIERYSADQDVRQQIEAHYQTSGRLQTPVVTLHTLRDPTVPYWHTALYQEKLGSAADLRQVVPVAQFGHCAFTEGEVQGAWDVLMGAV